MAATTRKQWVAWAVFVLVFMQSLACAAADVVVKALLKNHAVIEVDGQQKFLKAGESFAGITLISADSKRGVFEIDGERQTLTVGRRMGARYKEPEKTSVRIASQQGGHYFTPGRINGRPVTFLVDTGATTVALNSLVAQQLGVDYLAGQRHRVQTAAGIVAAYRVTLTSVAVGTLTLHNVEASVLEGAFPAQILLGNSYLSRVDMQVDNGVLVLQAKF